MRRPSPLLAHAIVKAATGEPAQNVGEPCEGLFPQHLVDIDALKQLLNVTVDTHMIIVTLRFGRRRGDKSGKNGESARVPAGQKDTWREDLVVVVAAA